MWVVTGASGQLGRQILEAVRRRFPHQALGASARDPEKVTGLEGVRLRKADYDDGASLRGAFEGATQVLMVSSNGRAFGKDSLAQHRTVIEAAKAAGVGRVLYTSHMASSAQSAFPPMHDHAATEQLLAGSGLKWTSLRNGFYASSALAMLEEAKTSGVVWFPADGPVSWTTHADLAEAAAVVLGSEGRFEGPTPPLVANEALDFEALAQRLAKQWGREVRREVVSDEALVQRMTARGVPQARIDITLGLFKAARAGEFRSNDRTLERLLTAGAGAA